MPILLDRRRFLGTLSAAGMATRVAVAANAPTSWALLSDVHIDADLNAAGANGENIYTNVAKSVGQIAASSAPICVIPGDIAHLNGTNADYAAFRQLISPVANRMPVLMTVGNHDSRTNFQRAFPLNPGVNQKISGRYVMILVYSDWRIIMLDSLIATNEAEGLLGSTQRSWLQRTLSRSNTPTLIFVHHDPGNTDISMADASQFLSIVRSATQVKAVFFGHQHVYQVSSVSGLHLVQLPSAAYHFDSSQPIGWVQMAMNSAGAKLTLTVNSGNFSQNGTSTNLTWR